MSREFRSGDMMGFEEVWRGQDTICGVGVPDRGESFAEESGLIGRSERL